MGCWRFDAGALEEIAEPLECRPIAEANAVVDQMTIVTVFACPEADAPYLLTNLAKRAGR